MSRTFFHALGRSLMRKQASRMPWPHVIQTLRQRNMLPEMFPHLPYFEPDVATSQQPEIPPDAPAPPEIPPEILAELLRQEQLPVPLSMPTEKEVPEPRPPPRPGDEVSA